MGLTTNYNLNKEHGHRHRCSHTHSQLHTHLHKDCFQNHSTTALLLPNMDDIIPDDITLTLMHPPVCTLYLTPISFLSHSSFLSSATHTISSLIIFPSSLIISSISPLCRHMNASVMRRFTSRCKMQRCWRGSIFPS